MIEALLILYATIGISFGASLYATASHWDKPPIWAVICCGLFWPVLMPLAICS